MDFNTVIYSTDIKSEDPCQEDLTLKNEKNSAKSFIDFKVKSEPNPENEDSLQDEEIQMNDEFGGIISSLKGNVFSMPTHGENQEKVHGPICNLKIKHEKVNLLVDNDIKLEIHFEDEIPIDLKVKLEPDVENIDINDDFERIRNSMDDINQDKGTSMNDAT